MKTLLIGLAVILTTLPARAADIYVIDGDTIVVSGEHIRIANIDAPEILHFKCTAEYRLGERAKARMEVIVASGALTIARGDHGRMRDRYGRSLGRVMIDGQDAGAMLVAEGLAHWWDGRRHPWCD